MRDLQTVPLPDRLEECSCLLDVFNRAVGLNREPDLTIAVVPHQESTWLACFLWEAEINNKIRVTIRLFRAQAIVLCFAFTVIMQHGVLRDPVFLRRIVGLPAGQVESG